VKSIIVCLGIAAMTGVVIVVVCSIGTGVAADAAVALGLAEYLPVIIIIMILVTPSVGVCGTGGAVASLVATGVSAERVHTGCHPLLLRRRQPLLAVKVRGTRLETLWLAAQVRRRRRRVWLRGQL
jgi:hypothetical protein